MKMSIARCIGAAVTLVFATALCAADTEAPGGPVVLTVAGNIANTNRPAYNEKRDVFVKYHERRFDQAFEFDRVMLERLGVTQIRIEYERWDGPITFSGPRLAEVLKAAGWRGGALVTLGLDGYSTPDFGGGGRGARLGAGDQDRWPCTGHWRERPAVAGLRPAGGAPGYPG